MPIFYRGPGAHVTHEVFRVPGPMSRSFAIRELRRIHIVQTQDDGDGTLSGLIKGGAIVLSAVALVVALTVRGMEAAAMWTVLGLLVVGVSATVSAGCWRAPPSPYELRASYRGRVVCLLRTPDEKILGQVSRALVRALELADAQPDAGADGRV